MMHPPKLYKAAPGKRCAGSAVRKAWCHRHRTARV